MNLPADSLVSRLILGGRYRMQDGVLERRCWKCRAWKPFSPEFYPHRARGALGLDTRCHACNRAGVRAWLARKGTAE